jgi:hypothetical protein
MMAVDPAHGPGERSAREVEPVHAAVAFAHEQARPLEHAQVAGDGRGGEPERFGEFADARLATREPFEHATAYGVGEGREHGVEIAFQILNHVVNR